MPRLGGALDIVQVADPAPPAAGRQYLYFKSNGLLYSKKSDGTVTQIGAGSGTTTFIDGGATPSEAYDGITVTAGAGAFDGAYSSLSGVPSSFTPSPHASSHASGGGDPLTLAISQITDLSTELASKFSGTNKPAASDLSATGTRDSTTFLRGDNTWAAPPGRVELIKSADQAIQHGTAATYVDISDLAWSAAANTTYEFDGIIWFTVAATTTGHRWGFVGPGTALANITMEYMTSATAWATYVQQHANTSMTGTPPMSTVTASALAVVPNILRVKGIIKNGATAGTIKMQGASELNSASVTVLKGSLLTYKAS